MKTENLNEKVKKQAIRIKKLVREKQALKKEIEKLNKDLYFENEKKPNNHKTMLRVKDIVSMYSVGKSTVWLYAKNKDITPIKNSSRVTTFDAEEVESFFKSINKKAKDISPNLNTKVAREEIIENIVKIKSSPQSPLNKNIFKK